MRRIWKMKDGTKIKIRDMESSHIKNCIAMLQRYHARIESEMWSIPEPNGEMAALDLDNALRDMEENGHRDWAQEFIDSFEAELERRKNNERR